VSLSVATGCSGVSRLVDEYSFRRGTKCQTTGTSSTLGTRVDMSFGRPSPSWRIKSKTWYVPVTMFLSWFAAVMFFADSDEETFDLVVLTLPIGFAIYAVILATAVRRDLYRPVWWTMLAAPLLVATFLGPIALVWSLEYRYSRAKGYRKAREQFLEAYPERRRLLDEKRALIVPQDVREREFMQRNPSAVLRRAPRDAREFELIATSWMQFWGEHDAVTTQFSGDGGVDVLSSNFGAQVKFYSNKPVGRPEVQSLVGAAAGHGVRPVFFAYSTGYTAEALQWAQSMDVACFTFVPQQGNAFEFEANTNAAAELILREEGISYTDYVESQELEAQYVDFQHELPPFLRGNVTSAP